jgi:DNA transformation protein
MPKSNELCDHVMDLLAPMGSPRYRAMFGGYAIYLDEMMVAIVAGDVLMLRADDENRPDYEARGIGPFLPYPEKGMGSMPFFTVPDDVFEDRDRFLDWAEKARQATLRHEARKTKKSKRGK